MPKWSGPIGRLNGSKNTQKHNSGWKRHGSGCNKAMHETQINRPLSHLVSTKTNEDAQQQKTILHIQNEVDAQRNANTNSSITEEEISTTLKQKGKFSKSWRKSTVRMNFST